MRRSVGGMERTKAWMLGSFAAAALLGAAAIYYGWWRTQPQTVTASEAAETLMTGVAQPDPPVVWVFVLGGAAFVALVFALVLAAHWITQADVRSRDAGA